MPFKDTKEGQTHFENDGCGEPAHNMPKDTTIEGVVKEFDEKWKLYFGDCHCNKSVFEDFLRTALTSLEKETREKIWRKITKELGNMSYTGVLDSNEKRRGYDIARQEIIEIVSAITHNKQ